MVEGMKYLNGECESHTYYKMADLIPTIVVWHKFRAITSLGFWPPTSAPFFPLLLSSQGLPTASTSYFVTTGTLECEAVLFVTTVFAEVLAFDLWPKCIVFARR
jgi:hypothetical protein